MPQDRAPSFIAESVIFAVIATTALALRCVARIITKTKFWWDDWFAILALPMILTEIAVSLYWTSIGLGKHVGDISAQNLSKGSVLIFLEQFFYDLGTQLPKMSALFFYERVFGSASRSFRYSVWFGQFLVTGRLIYAIISTIWQCTPIKKAYAPQEVAGGHCINTYDWYIGGAIVSMITDLYILLIPLPMLWHLQATIKRRLAVIGVFICGYSVFVVSIGRLVSIAQTNKSFERDVTWALFPYLNWVTCEGPISLTSVCLPSMLQLGKYMHERSAKLSSFPFFKSFTGKTGATTSDSSKLPRKSTFAQLEEDNSDLAVLDQGRSGRQVHVVRSESNDGINPDTDVDIELNQVRIRNEVDITESREWDAVRHPIC
ncbi:MAG: hypothetical protein M1822_006106 [Bathelium mastoideum]|nr:MAG: hypothetical protein M1822_006106 [Bathelium mastoideum]